MNEISKIYPDFAEIYKAELKAQNDKRRRLKKMEKHYTNLVEFMRTTQTHLSPDIRIYGNSIHLSFTANENDTITTFYDFVNTLSSHYGKETPAKGWSAFSQNFTWDMHFESMEWCISIAVFIPGNGIRDLILTKNIREYTTTEYMPQEIPMREIDWHRKVEAL